MESSLFIDLSSRIVLPDVSMADKGKNTAGQDKKDKKDKKGKEDTSSDTDDEISEPPAGMENIDFSMFADDLSDVAIGVEGLALGSLGEKISTDEEAVEKTDKPAEADASIETDEKEEQEKGVLTEELIKKAEKINAELSTDVADRKIRHASDLEDTPESNKGNAEKEKVKPTPKQIKARRKMLRVRRDDRRYTPVFIDSWNEVSAHRVPAFIQDKGKTANIVLVESALRTELMPMKDFLNVTYKKNVEDRMHSQAIMIKATVPVLTPGDKFIAAMPMFHGFGLGICIHCMLYAGAETILIPRFTAKSYVKLISESKCSYFAGVPTLFEAILRVPHIHGLDFSHLKGIFSGGDSLSPELKDRFDRFLSEHNSPVQVREGYGATETLSACCLSPKEGAKRGSIGFPFADMSFKIVDRDTGKEMKPGETGEIIISGPLVMKEYIGNPEETAQTLREDENGVKWLYTGDLGMMDEEGFVFFKGRAKRMIIASGYNVYPNQVEAVLEEHPKVEKACVIGVADKYRMQKIKAFIHST